MNRDTIIAILKEHIGCEPWSNVGCDLVGIEDAADALLAAMPKPAAAPVPNSLNLEHPVSGD